VLGFGMTASARLLHPHGVVGKHEGSLAKSRGAKWA
jgi:hypothetical protein